MSKEKFFIFGSVIGDGSFYTRPKIGDYTIEVEQKNKEWLENLSEEFLSEFGKFKEPKEKRVGIWRLRIHSKKIFQQLKKMVQEFPENILKSNTESKKKFLQGIFDSEGSVHKTKFRITFSNKNETIIETVKSLLKEFGIKYGKTRKEKWGVQVIPINGKQNLILFQNLIGFTHPEKHEKLEKILT